MKIENTKLHTFIRKLEEDITDKNKLLEKILGISDWNYEDLDDNKVNNIKVELNNNKEKDNSIVCEKNIEKNIEIKNNKINPKEMLKLVIISKYRQMLREYKLSNENITNENNELKKNLEYEQEKTNTDKLKNSLKEMTNMYNNLKDEYMKLK